MHVALMELSHAVDGGLRTLVTVAGGDQRDQRFRQIQTGLTERSKARLEVGDGFQNVRQKKMLAVRNARQMLGGVEEHGGGGMHER